MRAREKNRKLSVGIASTRSGNYIYKLVKAKWRRME